MCVLGSQVEDAATQFGAGLVQLGVETGQDSFVGIYARNSPEVSDGPLPPPSVYPSLLPSLFPSLLPSLFPLSSLPQWVVTEQSCNYYSRVLVPLYDTLGAEAVAYIINQS